MKQQGEQSVMGYDFMEKSVILLLLAGMLGYAAKVVLDMRSSGLRVRPGSEDPEIDMSPIPEDTHSD